MKTLMPEVAAWYQDVATGTLFEVVAIDEVNDTIEVQMRDGELGEYDSATWKQLFLNPAEAPEDWRSPYELNLEDSTYSDQTMIPENFSGALSDLEPDLMDLGDDFQLF